MVISYIIIIKNNIIIYYYVVINQWWSWTQLRRATVLSPIFRGHKKYYLVDINIKKKIHIIILKLYKIYFKINNF